MFDFYFRGSYLVMRWLIVILSLIPVCASAQISLDELSSEVDVRVKTLTTFADALADEDPRRALAAMQIMIEKGDADQRRMAIRSGLYSTDLAIRTEVLRSILNNGPALNIYIAPKGKEVNQYYTRFIRSISGTINPDMTATLVKKIGQYDSDQKCWLQDRTKKCAARLNADVVALYIDTWGQLTLDREGNLKGSMDVSQTPVEVTIPLSE